MDAFQFSEQKHITALIAPKNVKKTITKEVSCFAGTEFHFGKISNLLAKFEISEPEGHPKYVVYEDTHECVQSVELMRWRMSSLFIVRAKSRFMKH